MLAQTLFGLLSQSVFVVALTRPEANSTWFVGDYGPNYKEWSVDYPGLKLEVQIEHEWHFCENFPNTKVDTDTIIYSGDDKVSVYCWHNSTIEHPEGETLLRTTDDCWLNEMYVQDGDQTVDANGNENGTVIDYTSVLPNCGYTRPFNVRWLSEKALAQKAIQYYQLPCWRKPDGKWNQTSNSIVGDPTKVFHEQTVWGNEYWCWVEGTKFNQSNKWYEYGYTIWGERCWIPEEFLEPWKGGKLAGGDETCPEEEWP